MKNESELDRQHQKEILDAVCSAKHLSYEITPTFHFYDARLFRKGRLHAVAEVKWRNHIFGTYHDYTIDVEKIRRIIEEAIVSRVHAVLIVSWRGDIRYVLLRKMPNLNTSFQQRKDRYELEDEVAHIPLDQFVKLNETL
jgi:hypothetical protein